MLLIFSGVMLGLAFPPFPFPFTLLIFTGLIPYFIVIKKRTTLASISRATFLFSFVFSILTIYWVGSWSSEADPFLMMGGAALLFAYPCVLLIPSTLYYLAKKVFPKFDALWLFPIFWVTLEFTIPLVAAWTWIGKIPPFHSGGRYYWNIRSLSDYSLRKCAFV